MTLSICASDLDVCIPWRGVLAHAPPPPPPDRPSVAGPNLTDTFNTFYNITQRGGPSARALATIAGRGPVPRDRSRSTSASGGNREAAARLHRGRPLVTPRATRPAALRSGKRRAPAGPSTPGGHPRLGRRPGPARRRAVFRTVTALGPVRRRGAEGWKMVEGALPPHRTAAAAPLPHREFGRVRIFAACAADYGFVAQGADGRAAAAASFPSSWPVLRLQGRRGRVAGSVCARPAIPSRVLRRIPARPPKS